MNFRILLPKGFVNFLLIYETKRLWTYYWFWNENFKILLLEVFYVWFVILKRGLTFFLFILISELKIFNDFLIVKLYGFLVMIHFWNKGVLWNDFGLVLWYVFRTRLKYDLQLLRSYIKDFVLFTYKLFIYKHDYTDGLPSEYYTHSAS